MDSREHESISVDPIWVLWVVVHEFVEENVSDWSHAHRSSRMTGVGLCGGINLFRTMSAAVPDLARPCGKLQAQLELMSDK